MGLLWTYDGTWSPRFAGQMESASDLDPIYSAGSLFLTEVAHPVDPWPAGVPASGSNRPNVFMSNARDLVGDPAAEVRALIQSQQGTDTGTDMRRTSKGALHVATSSATDAALGEGLDVYLSAPVYSYIKGSGHEFYYSLWVAPTRLPDTSAGTTVVGNIASNTTFLGGFAPDSTVSSDPSSKSEPASNTLGAKLRAVAASSVPMAGTAEPSFYSNRAVFTVGPRASANRTAARRGKTGAAKFYRAYVEDLTISGRTYAQVLAIDKAMFDTAFAQGGRYYGDNNG